jgi:proteic killer suppression protein
MIVGFRHRGLEIFFRTGSTRGIQASHVKKLRNILGLLEVAAGPADMNLPSFRLHALKQDLKRHCSVWVNGNWRVTFRFVGADAELVDYGLSLRT